jgi:HAMP domain-containing protein
MANITASADTWPQLAVSAGAGMDYYDKCRFVVDYHGLLTAFSPPLYPNRQRVIRDGKAKANTLWCCGCYCEIETDRPHRGIIELRNARALERAGRLSHEVETTMTTNEVSRQEGTDDESNDELPASTTRFGYYVADSVEETADYSNAMRCLSDADSLSQKDSYGLAANSVRAAARRLNRVADSLQAEHESDSEGQ